MLGRFSSLLGRKLLKSSADKLLYGAKYLWYADMLAFRETGRCMSGATYAALPHGHQLNNYRELIPLIKDADESEAEPLTDHEERILARIVMAFPSDQKVYGAAHLERLATAGRMRNSSLTRRLIPSLPCRATRSTTKPINEWTSPCPPDKDSRA